jgi:Flp pilus assembly protein TadB
MSRRHRRDDAAVIAVTSAQPGHSQELDSRIARYAWMMSIRIVCFILAVVTPSPWRWGFVVAAIFLPYVAVVLANARRTAGAREGIPFIPPERPQLDTKK